MFVRRPITDGRGRITSPFGPRGNHFHAGVDFGGVAVGEPVLAASDGIVVFADGNGLRDPKGYGKQIIIQHEGFWTQYAHLNTVNVTEGQNVQAGEIIGSVGNTGYSTGPHLHFEIRTKMTYSGNATNTKNPLNHIIDVKQYAAYAKKKAEETPPRS